MATRLFGLFRLVLSLLMVTGAALVPSVCRATPEELGRLKAIVSELRDEAKAIAKDSAAVKDELATAQEQRAALQTSADQLAAQASANAAAALKTAAAYRAALLEAEEMHESRNWWRNAALLLFLAAGLYIAARLHPATRLFIP